MPGHQVGTEGHRLEPDLVARDAYAPSAHTDHNRVADHAVSPNRRIVIGENGRLGRSLQGLLRRGKLLFDGLERQRGPRLVVEKDVDVFLLRIVPQHLPVLLIAILVQEGVLIDALRRPPGVPWIQHPVDVVEADPVDLQRILERALDELRVRVRPVPERDRFPPLLNPKPHIGLSSEQVGGHAGGEAHMAHRYLVRLLLVERCQHTLLGRHSWSPLASLRPHWPVEPIY